MKIGNIRIDTSLYAGNDTYSDGPVEDQLLNLAKEGKGLEAALVPDSAWPVFYHFHPARQNVLAWYDFSGDEKVLEIGSGCGAITGLLAHRCAEVVCNDISLKRSQINAYRNRDCANVQILVGNYADLRLGQDFDIVTLIGVLEYACSYYPSGEKNPFLALLRAARAVLRPEGMLMLAIENQFGLKYWAGAREDHSARLYDGLEGYPGDAPARTFSLPALTALLEEAGFTRLAFHYPYPDYKFCREIYSDARLPKPGELRDPVHNYDLDRVQNFNEELVYDEIIRAGQFPFFSNSFLVLCRQADRRRA